MRFNTSHHLTEAVRALALKGFAGPEARQKDTWESRRLWQRLRRLGTRLWLDTGDLKAASQRWTAEFEALTTNNTLLNREVQKGIYDHYIAETLSSSSVLRDLDRRQRIIELARILNARHGLRLVERFNAWVSVELHTDLADDLEGTVWYGKRLFQIYPERFLIKVPLTPSGYLAARRLREAGVRVNFTLGFSARQNYLATLLAEPGFVNVFLGRLNSFVADNGLGHGENVGEKTLAASQDVVAELREQRNLATQQIAASMRAGDQVTALAGVDVMTLPVAVADDFVSSEVSSNELIPLADQQHPIALEKGQPEQAVNTLWEVPRSFRQVTAAMLDEPLEDYDADDLRAFFAERGLGGLFPEWSEDDLRAICEDGKIPSYPRWADRLHSGDAALDALMSISGLKQFAADQQALDDRITAHFS